MGSYKTLPMRKAQRYGKEWSQPGPGTLINVCLSLCLSCSKCSCLFSLADQGSGEGWSREATYSHFAPAPLDRDTARDMSCKYKGSWAWGLEAGSQLTFKELKKENSYGKGLVCLRRWLAGADPSSPAMQQETGRFVLTPSCLCSEEGSLSSPIFKLKLQATKLEFTHTPLHSANRHQPAPGRERSLLPTRWELQSLRPRGSAAAQGRVK